MKKIFLIVGARPNFIKAAPLYFELKKGKQFVVKLIHTGQHNDPFMSDAIFSDLGLAKPDVFLNVVSGAHTSKVKRIYDIFRLYEANKAYFKKEKPDLVVVFGDVFSTLVATFAAKKNKIRVAHVEAGLRSRDLFMPEEINRILVDLVSDLLFTPSFDADENLLKAGVSREKIFMVGNIMIDSLAKNKEKALDLKSFEKYKLEKGKYIYLTLHRQSNVDSKKVLTGITEALLEIAQKGKILFPVHPRTQDKLEKFGLLTLIKGNKNIILTKPAPYLENINLQANAMAVFTDSGGVQEETSYLGVPCFTLRKNTERPVTIAQGTNTLVGVEKEQILDACAWGNIKPTSKKSEIKYWDGNTAVRIVENINSNLE
jgi:UDP-N-acetylglucosamine 2-epimerase (non-hydrolysing)